jgi:mevalonate kinase
MEKLYKHADELIEKARQEISKMDNICKKLHNCMKRSDELLKHINIYTNNIQDQFILED